MKEDIAESKNKKFRFVYLMKMIIEAKDEKKAFEIFNTIELSEDNESFNEVIDVSENDW